MTLHRPDVITECDLLSKYENFSQNISTGVAKGTLTHPDTWFSPFLDLYMFYSLRPIRLPNLSYFFWTLHFEHPRCFLDFALYIYYIGESTNRHFLQDSFACCSYRYCQIYFVVTVLKVGGSGGRVVKLLACRARGPDFNSRPRHLNFQRLVYLLLPSRDMAERSLNRR